jgi:hypothetical protein
MIARTDREPPLTTAQILAAVGVFLLLGALFLACAMGVLVLYATWGGDCLERGGHIVDHATGPTCEGSRP